MGRLCRIMIMDYKGLLETDEERSGYGVSDLKFGIKYCDGWMENGRTHDLISGFSLKAFKKWCFAKLAKCGFSD